MKLTCGSAPIYLLVAALVLLANPAAAQTRDTAPTGCTGDGNCSQLLEPTGPLDRGTKADQVE